MLNRLGRELKTIRCRIQICSDLELIDCPLITLQPAQIKPDLANGQGDRGEQYKRQ